MPEKVLLVSTSTVLNVNQALQTIRDRLFQNPQVDILCTSGELPHFEGRTEFRQLMVFPQRRNLRAAFKLWRRIFWERYDVVSVLWCLDIGRMRSKLFALCCGGRRLLIFNENLDCAYLSPSSLKQLVVGRARNGTLIRHEFAGALLGPLKDGYWGLLRLGVFPLRLLILLWSVTGLYLGRVWRRR